MCGPWLNKISYLAEVCCYRFSAIICHVAFLVGKRCLEFRVCDKNCSRKLRKTWLFIKIRCSRRAKTIFAKNLSKNKTFFLRKFNNKYFCPMPSLAAGCCSTTAMGSRYAQHTSHIFCALYTVYFPPSLFLSVCLSVCLACSICLSHSCLTFARNTHDQ